MSQALPDNIDLRVVFATIKKRVPKLVAWALVASAATYLGLGLIAPRYQSEAELFVSAKGMLDPYQSPKKDGGSAESPTVRMDKEAVNTHVRALRSPELGAALAAQMKLAERREFNPELGPVDTLGRLLRLVGIGNPRPGESEQDRVLTRFYERLEVYSPKESRAIAIRFTSNDPALAAEVPNALAEAYRKSLANRPVVGPKEAQQALVANIISRARAASVPVFPRKGPFAALAALATLLLGLAITIARAISMGARGAAPALDAAKTPRAQPVLPAAPPAPPRLVIAGGAAPQNHQAAPSGHTADKRVLTEEDVLRVGSIGALARRILSRTETNGYRTLIAGETDLMGVSSHAIELAKALADLGHSVVLIDWSPEGDGVAHTLSIANGPGIGELLAGHATFEEIIRRIPESEAHMIGAGAFDGDRAPSPDPDRLNLILDALDEAYDQIIIAGRNEPARTFFETIEGRVDCGVLVADPGRIGSALRDPPGSYLGFEVAEIDLVRYDRQISAASNQRIIRTGRNPAAATG